MSHDGEHEIPETEAPHRALGRGHLLQLLNGDRIAVRETDERQATAGLSQVFNPMRSERNESRSW